jgi:hypothetical protein
MNRPEQIRARLTSVNETSPASRHNAIVCWRARPKVLRQVVQEFLGRFCDSFRQESETHEGAMIGNPR